MSSTGKKRSFHQENQSAEEERNDKRGFKRQKTSGFRKYSAKEDKSRWPDLLQSLDNQLLSNGISYLNKPQEVAAIKADPPEPDYIVFIPSLIKPTEEPHEKEVRDMKNNVKTAYHVESTNLSASSRIMRHDCLFCTN